MAQNNRLAKFYHTKVYKFSMDCDILKSTPTFYQTDTASHAFKELKLALTTTLVMAIVDPNLPFEVMTNASNLATGAILMQ